MLPKAAILHMSPKMEVGLCGRMMADPNARQNTIWYNKYMKDPMIVVPLVASLAIVDNILQQVPFLSLSV